MTQPPPAQPNLPAPRADYFRQLADGAPVMIWMSGLDMGCFYFNRAWLEFRGRTHEQEFGNGWAEGVHPEDLQRCVNHYVGCFERRVAFAMSYRLQHASGEHRWILDRGVPHYLPDGTFVGFYGGCAVLDDATVTRHAELGITLAEMRVFARRVALEAAASFPAFTGESLEAALRSKARSIQSNYEDEARRKAAAEMEKLAVDMVAFRDIERGGCLPRVA